MDRYAKKDHERELYIKEHGNDTFGLDKISAASAAHGGDDDNKRIREIFDTYTTGAKGSNGLPNGERWIEKWNAELAAEDVIKEWVGDKISDGAVKKFLKDNLAKSWKTYDMYDRGHIDMFSVVPFMRDLMSSLSAPDAPQKNPYEFDSLESLKDNNTSTNTTTPAASNTNSTAPATTATPPVTPSTSPIPPVAPTPPASKAQVKASIVQVKVSKEQVEAEKQQKQF